MEAAVKLVVGRFELVPDLRLGPAGDLAPDPLAVRAEADRDRCPLPNDLARPDVLSWSWAIFNGKCV